MPHSYNLGSFSPLFKNFITFDGFSLSSENKTFFPVHTTLASRKSICANTTFAVDLFVWKENAGNNNNNNKVDDNGMNETWEGGTMKVKGTLSTAFAYTTFCQQYAVM